MKGKKEGCIDDAFLVSAIIWMFPLVVHIQVCFMASCVRYLFAIIDMAVLTYRNSVSPFKPPSTDQSIVSPVAVSDTKSTLVADWKLGERKDLFRTFLQKFHQTPNPPPGEEFQSWNLTPRHGQPRLCSETCLSILASRCRNARRPASSPRLIPNSMTTINKHPPLVDINPKVRIQTSTISRHNNLVI